MAKAKIEGSSVEWSESGAFDIRFIDGMFDEGNPALAGILRPGGEDPAPRLLLVADSNVVHRTEGLGSKIGKYLNDCGVALAGTPVVVGGGEKSKSDGMTSVRRVMEAAIEARIGRNDFIFALGGGAVLDVAGYAAAQVRGGVRLVRSPTTPASMVDGSFALDACINCSGIKDALRLPSRPYAVVIDTNFAPTVLDGVWRGGAGEIIRYAAARDAALLKKVAKITEKIRNRDAATMSALVRECVESRFKKGRTDFAQWSALRMETMSGNKLPHGYAVPLAICIDCAYASEKGYMKQEDMAMVCSALADCGALDGLAHSLHILNQGTSILYGLDAWRLSTGSEAIEVPAGIGKTVVEEKPDRGIFEKTIKDFLAASQDI